jgi:hypothetical protein
LILLKAGNPVCFGFLQLFQVSADGQLPFDFHRIQIFQICSKISGRVCRLVFRFLQLHL